MNGMRFWSPESDQDHVLVEVRRAARAATWPRFMRMLNPAAPEQPSQLVRQFAAALLNAADAWVDAAISTQRGWVVPRCSGSSGVVTQPEQEHAVVHPRPRAGRTV